MSKKKIKKLSEFIEEGKSIECKINAMLTAFAAQYNVDIEVSLNPIIEGSHESPYIQHRVEISIPIHDLNKFL